MRLLKIAAVLTVLAGAVALGVVLAPEAAGQVRVRAPRARAAVQLLAGGAHIGVTVRDVDPADAKQKVLSGVAIDEVYADSPASRAGLKAGDVVVEFDGERVRGARQFSRLVAETPEGRGVKLGLMRDGQRLTVDITPETRSGVRSGEWAIGDDFVREDLHIDIPPMPKIAIPEFEFKTWTRTGRLGLQLDTLTPQLATYFGVKRGALVTSVDEGSAAEKAGLKAGDVIVAIDGRTVEDTADLYRALRGTESGSEVSIDIVRDRKAQTLKATPDWTSGSRKLRRRATDI